MTDSLKGPSGADDYRRLVRRVDDLERRLRTRSAPDQAGYLYLDVPFDYTSGVDPSKRYSPPFTAELIELYGTLTDDGSTSTTVDLTINGGAQETLTVASSAFSGTETVSHVLEGRVDYMQLEATLGTGADGLLICALFRWRP